MANHVLQLLADRHGFRRALERLGLRQERLRWRFGNLFEPSQCAPGFNHYRFRSLGSPLGNITRVALVNAAGRPHAPC